MLTGLAHPAQAAVTEAWVHRYSNVVNDSSDRAIKVAHDAAGNMIVTGTSGSAILTIKYSSADGSVLWQTRSKGTENRDDSTVATALASFRAAHQELYGFVLEAPVELVTLRVEAVGHLPAPVLPHLQPAAMPAPHATRAVHFPAGTLETPVIDRDALGAGTSFPGPAILTQLDATTLVPPGWTVTVHQSGALLVTRE